MFKDIFENQMRGEFKVIAKDKQGNIVYEYQDNNVVVDSARPVTAYALCQSVGGAVDKASWYEYSTDIGEANDKWTDSNLIDPQSFQISFIKMGGGFPRKRSIHTAGLAEVGCIPSTLYADSTLRADLYRSIPFVSSTSTVAASSWVAYNGPTDQPYHSSSLLYPRKTDKDLVDRDYQWGKKIINYGYSGTPSNSFKATFTTYMRFNEGNGPILDTVGTQVGVDDQMYEYREAGLFIGVPSWTFEDTPANQASIEYGAANGARNPLADAGEPLSNNFQLGLTWDSRLTDNLKQLRFWDGQSSVHSVPRATVNWDASLTWENTIANHNGTTNASNLTAMYNTSSNHNFKGKLYEGYYMVARKTFPMISKSKDLELTIQWNLVFGSTNS